MGSVFSSGKSKEEIEMALAKAKEIVNSNAVVVFRSAAFFSLIGFFFFFFNVFYIFLLFRL